MTRIHALLDRELTMRMFGIPMVWVVGALWVVSIGLAVAVFSE